MAGFDYLTMTLILEAQATQFHKALEQAATQIKDLEGTVNHLHGALQEARKESNSDESGLWGIITGSTPWRDAISELTSFGTRLIGFSSAVGGAVLAIHKMTEGWSDSWRQLGEFRRQMGHTYLDTLKIQATLLTTTARYGVALNQLAAIHTQVAYGSQRTQKALGGVLGTLGLFKQSTGASEESVADLSRVLSEDLGIGGNKVVQVMYAMRVAAQEGGVRWDDMSAGVTQLTHALYGYTRETQTRALPSMIALLEMAQRAKGKDRGFLPMVEILRQMTEGTGRLRAIFTASGHDIAATLYQVAGEMRNLTKEDYQSAKFTERWGDVTEEQVFLLQALDTQLSTLPKETREVQESMSASMDKIAKSLRKTRTPLEQLGDALNRFGASFANMFVGPKAIYGLEPFIKSVADNFNELAVTLDLLSKEDKNIFEGIIEGLSNWKAGLDDLNKGYTLLAQMMGLDVPDIKHGGVVGAAFTEGVRIGSTQLQLGFHVPPEGLAAPEDLVSPLGRRFKAEERAAADLQPTPVTVTTSDQPTELGDQTVRRLGEAFQQALEGLGRSLHEGARSGTSRLPGRADTTGADRERLRKGN